MLPSSTAKRIDGSANWMSVSRISRFPTRPARQPDTSPISVPIAAAPGTTIATTMSETQAPCRMRLRMSRPRSSAPREWFQLPPSKTGGYSRSASTRKLGSSGESSPAKAPQTTNTTAMAAGTERPA